MKPLTGLLLILILAGCVRVSGGAGVAYPKDNEMVYKSINGDLDTARLMNQGNP